MLVKLINFGLHYQYDEFPLLSNINLVIDNNRTGVYIQTQSGKTSLCRVFVEGVKYSGSILIDNVELTDIDFKERNFGYISSCPLLFNNKSVEYNMQYAAKIRKISDKELVSEAINKYKLNEYINCKAKKLDQDTKVLLMLARLSMFERKFIIADDYSSYSQTAQMQIEDYLSNNNCSQLIVTSNANQLEKCDIVYVIDNRQIIFCGEYIKAKEVIDSIPKFD